MKTPIQQLISVYAMLMFTHVAIAKDAVSGNIEQGKAKSRSCMGCHGMNGISVIPDYPSLAGKDAAYLAKQLTDYRNGKREHIVMKSISLQLTDADIANIVAYYASLPAKK